MSRPIIHVELYYVVASPSVYEGPPGARRWYIEGGPHQLHDALLVREERRRRLRNDPVDVEMVRVEVPMEVVR